MSRRRSAAPSLPQAASANREDERAQAIGAAWGLVSLSDSSSGSVSSPTQVWPLLKQASCESILC